MVTKKKEGEKGQEGSTILEKVVLPEIPAASHTQPSRAVPFRLAVFGIYVSSLCLTPYGTQEVVLNVPEHMLMSFVNRSLHSQFHVDASKWSLSSIWGSIVAMMPIGAIFGATTSTLLADRWGRKFCLIYYANSLAILGSVAMYMAQQEGIFELLMLGRLILGYSIGVTTTVLPIYLIECSPVENRGFMASLHGCSAYFLHSLVFGLSLPELLGTERSWGFLLSIQAVPALIAMFSGVFLPESPQYLYMKKHDPVAVEKALKFLVTDKEKVQQMLDRYQDESKITEKQLRFREIWEIRPIRSAFALAFVIGTIRNFSGVAVIHAYSTSMFETVGIRASLAKYSTLFIGIGGFCSCVVSTVLVDRVGRRGLLLPCLAWIIATWVAVLGLEFLPITPGVSILSLILLLIAFVVVYPLGPGTVVWYLASELVPEAGRATATGMSISTLWITFLISVFLYPILERLLGPISILLLFILPASSAFLILLIYLPETKQKSMVEIMGALGGQVVFDGPRNPPPKLKRSVTMPPEGLYGTFDKDKKG